MNEWVARHTPWIVTALHLCTIPQLVLYLGSHDKKYRIYHWIGEKTEIYSDNPLARDGTHQLKDAHHATAATGSNHGLQAPPRSQVAYQSRHPVHFHEKVFMNFVFDNFGDTMIFGDRHVSPLVFRFASTTTFRHLRTSALL